MGYSAVAIADRMGHESIDITYRYAHLFPTVQKDMAAKLNCLREGTDVE
jgi:integrase